MTTFASWSWSIAKRLSVIPSIFTLAQSVDCNRPFEALHVKQHPSGCVCLLLFSTFPRIYLPRRVATRQVLHVAGTMATQLSDKHIIGYFVQVHLVEYINTVSYSQYMCGRLYTVYIYVFIHIGLVYLIDGKGHIPKYVSTNLIHYSTSTLSQHLFWIKVDFA